MPYSRLMIRGARIVVPLAAALLLASGCTAASDIASQSATSAISSASTSSSPTVTPATPTSTPSAAHASDWAGNYSGPEDLHSQMKITDSLDIVWKGGGDDSLGAASAATCVAKARARVVDAHHLKAVSVPIETDDDGNPVPATASAASPPVVDPRASTFTLTRRGTQVMVEGSFPDCGLQTRLAGWWKRTGPVTPAFG